MGFDLEKRTLRFGEEILSLAKSLEKNIINNPLINQLVRAGTSIGANYFEANGASSKRDFKNKICICKKEARETKYWLELIAKNNEQQKEKCRNLWREAQELTLIFSKIILTIDRKENLKFKN